MVGLEGSTSGTVDDIGVRFALVVRGWPDSAECGMLVFLRAWACISVGAAQEKPLKDGSGERIWIDGGGGGANGTRG